MAFKKDANFTYNIEEFVGALKESTKHNWCKAVLRMKWGDNPSTLDIRSVNMADEKRIGKGISLSNEEADKLVSILIDEGYGSLEEIEAAIKKRRKTFFVTEPDEEDLYDPESEDGGIYIDINL